MRVIKSIADQIDECIATRQIGHYSLCQALDRLVRTHLSKCYSDFYDCFQLLLFSKFVAVSAIRIKSKVMSISVLHGICLLSGCDRCC